MFILIGFSLNLVDDKKTFNIIYTTILKWTNFGQETYKSSLKNYRNFINIIYVFSNLYCIIKIKKILLRFNHSKQ
jgi:hypothetical protein